ncbi:MAG: cytochrome c3 family protein [Planctomycetota bacterium]
MNSAGLPALILGTFLVALAELLAQGVDDDVWDEFVMDAVTQATTRYEPFVFRLHQKHVDRPGSECVDCHHLVDGEKTVEQSCSLCHNRPEEELDLEEACHQTCRDCHRKKAAEKVVPPWKPPLKCLDCHTMRMARKTTEVDDKDGE